MTYRKEIDGLRAIALLPVMLFHAGFGWFSGGYIGVDVFFVISGYLITSLILSDAQKGGFSIATFYERRARRIIPALTVVMIACVPIAWASMLPDDFENFGQSLVATTLFSNNILMWGTRGYFELANEFKPLLHTWSLGIEEQFYVLFPLVMLVVAPLGRKALGVTFTLLFLLSLGLAQWGVVRFPAATFYLLPFRMWELLLGALVAVYLFKYPADVRDPGNPYVAGAAAAAVTRPSRNWTSELRAALGLVLILGAAVGFKRHTPAPSLYTLLPTIGAALIILFAKPFTLTGRLLASPVLVGIGLISYSAYLWHQPLFAFVRIRSLDEPRVGMYWLLIGCSLALGGLTWRVVERPFRDRTFLGRRAIFGLTLAAGIVTAGLGWIIYANSGFAHQWDELNTDVRAAGRRLNAVYNEGPYRFKDLEFTSTDKKRLLIIGDSFARDFINAGLENGYFKQCELSYTDVVPRRLRSIDSIEPNLRRRIAAADQVIFASPLLSLETWKSDFDILRQAGAKKIIVMGNKNFGWNMNAVMRLDRQSRRSYRAEVRPKIWADNEAYRRALPPDIFVDILALIADENRRVPVFTPDEKLISQDSDHLTQPGARYIGKILFEHPLLAELAR